jgi:hypothetical protein
MALLATILPSRILVLHNAVVESDLRAPEPEYFDLLKDIACEAQRAAPGSVLRVIAPRPKGEESLEPRVRRPAALKAVGAIGLLEDTRDAITAVSAEDAVDAASSGAGQAKFATTAQEFFLKSMARDNAFGLPANVLATAGPAIAAVLRGGGEQNEEEEDAEEGAAATTGSSAAADGTGATGAAAAVSTRTKGLGKVFIECASVEAAINVQRELGGRFFLGRIIVTSFADARKWREGLLVDLSGPDSLQAPPEANETSAVAAAMEQQ